MDRNMIQMSVYSGVVAVTKSTDAKGHVGYFRDRRSITTRQWLRLTGHA